MSIYRIKLICHDSDLKVAPYYDDLPYNPAFNSQKEAWDFAYKTASDECESLNDGCEEDRTFGVCDDDNKDNIKVNCYTDNDDTYVVTEYIIYEVKSDITDTEYDKLFKDFVTRNPNWGYDTEFINWINDTYNKDRANAFIGKIEEFNFIESVRVKSNV